MNAKERKKLSRPFSFNPPRGFRFLLVGETILLGDYYLHLGDNYKIKYPCIKSINRVVNCVNDSYVNVKINNKRKFIFIRKKSA